MKNALLLFPPFKKYALGEKWEGSEGITPPLGLLYLASPLKKKGYKVTFLDLTVEKISKKEFEELVKKQDYALITCFTQSIHNTEKIIKDLRGINKKIKILCGGPFCNETQTYINGSDVTVIGEAEQDIIHIIESLNTNKELEKIPGLIYKKGNKIVRNKGVLEVKNLNLSLQPLIEVSKDYYGVINGVRIDNVAPILSSRGCPFSCAYCTYKLTKYRERSVNEVIKELEKRVKQGYKYFVFCDDNFLVNKKRVNKIMNGIIKKRLKVKIIVQGRVDNADINTYKKMRRAGVAMIIFGVESANQDVLDYYNKRTTVDNIRKAINTADEAGIITVGSFIIGAPFETREHFEKNKEFLKKEPLDFININVLSYIKGSRLWKLAREKNLLKDEDIHLLTNKNLCNFTTKELYKIQEEIVKSFYTPSRVFRIIRKTIGLGETMKLFHLFKLFIQKEIYRVAGNRYGFDKKSVKA